MDRRSFMIASAGGIGRAALPAGVVAMAGCTGTAPTVDTTGFEGATMGTRYSVRLAAPLETEALDELAAAVDAVLGEVDARMSTYRRDSELSRFNRSRDSGWQALSNATTRVLAHARDASRDSAGAFDATVGPLVNLWGFGPVPSSGRPAASDVDRILERVGWRTVEVDAERGAARKRRPDAYLDLSGIAKGFGVDAAAALLDSRGFEDYLVEVGGELRCRGLRPGGAPWRVAVERPTPGRRAVHRALDLKGRAIATSGDYRNFFDEGERRYTHNIDPRTGRPVQHALASASVIAPSAMEADAASTALMVLGPEAGLEWASRRGLAALLLVRERSGLRELATAALEPHLPAGARA